MAAVNDKKPIRSAGEIRGAEAATVTALRAEMKTTSTELAESVVGEATDQLFTQANNPAADGPYDAEGVATLTIRLEKLPGGAKVADWLSPKKTLPVDVRPLLQAAVSSTFKDAAQLDVLNYDVVPTPRTDGYSGYVPGSFSVRVTIKDPEYANDPILSKSVGA